MYRSMLLSLSTTQSGYTIALQTKARKRHTFDQSRQGQNIA